TAASTSRSWAAMSAAGENDAPPRTNRDGSPSLRLNPLARDAGSVAAWRASSPVNTEPFGPGQATDGTTMLCDSGTIRVPPGPPVSADENEVRRSIPTLMQMTAHYRPHESADGRKQTISGDPHPVYSTGPIE